MRGSGAFSLYDALSAREAPLVLEHSRRSIEHAADGTWTFGGDGAAGDPPELELDAVEFCRILCGRGSGPGLLTTRVPL